MFREGKIDEDTVDCPRFVAFKGASREHSSSSFNLGQLTKRIHGESDEFDEEEARQAQRKDRRRRAPFYLESPIGFTFTWNRPLCAVLMLLGGGGAVLYCLFFLRFCRTWTKRCLKSPRRRGSNALAGYTTGPSGPEKKRLFGLAAHNRLSLSLPLFHSLLRLTAFLSQYKNVFYCAWSWC